MIFVHNGRKFNVEFAAYYFKTDKTYAILRGLMKSCTIDFPEQIRGLGIWQLGETEQSLKSYQVICCVCGGWTAALDLKLLVDRKPYQKIFPL